MIRKKIHSRSNASKYTVSLMNASKMSQTITSEKIVTQTDCQVRETQVNK